MVLRLIACILLVEVGGAICVFNSFVQKPGTGVWRIIVRLLFSQVLMACLGCINDVIMELFVYFMRLYRRKI